MGREGWQNWSVMASERSVCWHEIYAEMNGVYDIELSRHEIIDASFYSVSEF